MFPEFNRVNRKTVREGNLFAVKGRKAPIIFLAVGNDPISFHLFGNADFNHDNPAFELKAGIQCFQRSFGREVVGIADVLQTLPAFVINPQRNARMNFPFVEVFVFFGQNVVFNKGHKNAAGNFIAAVGNDSGIEN